MSNGKAVSAIYKKKLIIFYDEGLNVPEIQKLPSKDLIKPYFIMPTQDYKFRLIGSTLEINNGFSAQTDPMRIFGEIEKIVLNPENEKFLVNNHITIFIPNGKYLGALNYYKKNFEKVQEFRERL